MSVAFTKVEAGAIASLASSLFVQGRLQEASVLFLGLASMHNNAYGEAGLGAVAMAQDPPDLEAAERHLTEAVRLDPSDPSIRTNYGEALLRLGRIDEAAVELMHSLELDPNGHTSAA